MKEKMRQIMNDNNKISGYGTGCEICKDVFYYTNNLVNVVMLGDPREDKWLLIDAGMPGSGEEILKVAEARFGNGKAPAAIILTHGHFDHVGGLVHLINEWGVPVFAHPLEFVYLIGEKKYPEPEISEGGKEQLKISSFYPCDSINISGVLQELPEDNSLPEFPDWQWIHVPGHSPGQVAFFRQKDKVLIAGDAFTTVKMDLFYNFTDQNAELNGPPVYFTTNWEKAENSVQKLIILQPESVITGHGPHLSGYQLKRGMENLLENLNRQEELAPIQIINNGRKKI